MAIRCQVGQLWYEPAFVVEELFRTVALHPRFENADVLGLLHVAHRDLMAAPIPLAFLAIDLRRTRPALRRAKDDHRPARALRTVVVLTRFGPDAFDLRHDAIERVSKLLMNDVWIVA